MDVQKGASTRSRARRRVFAIAAAALAFTVGWMVLGELQPAAPMVDRSSIWVDTVRMGQMDREVRGTGTLVPRESRWVVSRSPAQVDRILVKAGALVEPDTIILVMNNPELLEQLHASEAEQASAQAELIAERARLRSALEDLKVSLIQARSDYEMAKVQFEAEQEACSAGVLSAVQCRKTQIGLKQREMVLSAGEGRVREFARNINAFVAAKEAVVKQTRSNALFRRSQVNALQVRAGIGGILQQVSVEEGQRIAEGTSLARVARPDSLMARLRVPEAQARDIANGMPVTIDTRNGIINGEVTRVDPSVSEGSVGVDVDLLDKLPLGARPDLSIDGRIKLEQLDQVLHMARPVVGQTNATVSMFRLDGNGGATRVKVSLGSASLDQVEVRNGLYAGDQVIISDMSQWDKYDHINLR